jgi:hypothetical protein
MATIRSRRTANVANAQSVGESGRLAGNAPFTVLQEMTVILATAFGLATAANLLLAFLHVKVG